MVGAVCKAIAGAAAQQTSIVQAEVSSLKPVGAAILSSQCSHELLISPVRHEQLHAWNVQKHASSAYSAHGQTVYAEALASTEAKADT